MGHQISHLPAAATATRTGGQGGWSGGPERIDFLFVVSVIIIIIIMIYYYGPSPPLPPARGRFVRAGRSFSRKNHMLGFITESFVACFCPNGLFVRQFYTAAQKNLLRTATGRRAEVFAVWKLFFQGG